MPDLILRPATRSDLPEILELLAQDSIGDRPTLSAEERYPAFDAIAAHPDHEIIVGTIGNKVVATLQLSFLPGLSRQCAWRAQIEAVRVRRDLRNAGIGTEIMHWAIARARERGCRLVQLTTNRARKDAHRFYERLGFEASHVGMKLHL
jgi:GNAT superfamily N-acetyltransferase